mgnify:CR=1 FL=1|tara:strand:+ start:2226 stop:2681 length:456 start_codon:yes stop_codon:yes gene_type:complete
MNTNRHLNRKQRGFTLIEVIVVLMLLGLLVITNYNDVFGKEDSGNLTVLDSQFKVWQSAAESYYSNNNMSYAGMSNTELVDTYGLVKPPQETNYMGGANTIASSAGNIKQYTWTAAGIESGTANQMVLRYSNVDNVSGAYSGGNLVMTVTK